MSDTLTLPAETRAKTGKGASRSLRREGRVPVVVYGGGAEPLAVHVEAKELVRQLNTGKFFDRRSRSLSMARPSRRPRRTSLSTR
jgi:ribosomal protein L25 (general stress protein Ctc)